MAKLLKFVSSPVGVKIQSYYSAASTGFTTWAGAGDGTQPPGTGAVQSIELAAGANNVVDVNACTWLASFIASRSADSLLSQIAILANPLPDPSAQPIPVVVG